MEAFARWYDTLEHGETRQAALDGARIAGDARKGIEDQTKRSIITKGRDLPRIAQDQKKQGET